MLQVSDKTFLNISTVRQYQLIHQVLRDQVGSGSSPFRCSHILQWIVFENTNEELIVNDLREAAIFAMTNEHTKRLVITVMMESLQRDLFLSYLKHFEDGMSMELFLLIFPNAMLKWYRQYIEHVTMYVLKSS